MAEFAGMTNLEVWYARLDVEEVVARYQATMPRKVVKRAEKNVAKARTKDSMQALARLTHEVDGEPRITADPPLIVPIGDLLPDDRAGGVHRVVPRAPARVPAHARDRPPPPAGALPASSTWPARWSAWAASARARGSP